MICLITGAAGFIGFHTCRHLLDQGYQVIGLDNLNDYYSVALKQARLQQLQHKSNFVFYHLNVSDRLAIDQIIKKHPNITHIIHLAAQAGVRYSLQNPYVYIEANVLGQVVLFEAVRSLFKLEHFIYASSSSVYGGNRKLPFSVNDRCDDPLSLYAATKRSGELIASTYHHLYQLPLTGLRFFTVYGPWGRPDMSAYLFTKALYEDQPITLFNHGNMWRDFTFIDDIVAGIMGCLQKIPTEHKIYNLGNHRSEHLLDFLGVLEAATGRKGIITYAPMPVADVPETFADITESTKDFGFMPTTTIEEGLPRFVDWYKSYHGLEKNKEII